MCRSDKTQMEKKAIGKLQLFTMPHPTAEFYSKMVNEEIEMTKRGKRGAMRTRRSPEGYSIFKCIDSFPRIRRKIMIKLVKGRSGFRCKRESAFCSSFIFPLALTDCAYDLFHRGDESFSRFGDVSAFAISDNECTDGSTFKGEVNRR